MRIFFQSMGFSHFFSEEQEQKNLERAMEESKIQAEQEEEIRKQQEAAEQAAAEDAAAKKAHEDAQAAVEAPTVEDTALPPGWEEKKTPDGRVFYIDHNTK